MKFELLVIRTLKAIIIGMNTPETMLTKARKNEVLLAYELNELGKFENDLRLRDGFEDSH